MNDDISAQLLRHFFNISRHLAGNLDFASAINAVADEIALFLPYDHLDVCMLQPEGDQITAAYESGLATEWALTPSTPAMVSPVRSLLSGEVDFLLTQDATVDPRFIFEGAFNTPIFAQQLRARMHVPLMVKAELIGVLSISAQQVGRYTPDDIAIARTIADILAPYFHAIRATEQARQSALTEAQARKREEALRIGALELTQLLEHERQRIGMDLHDQTLADLTRLLRDLRQGGAAAEPAAVAAKLQDCVAELRRTIDMAAPTILELFGLAHAVRIHLERAIGERDIPHQLIETAGSAPDTLNPETRVALFRIAQEAINNAVQHAQATQITVEIALEHGNQLLLSVRDNGHGLPQAPATAARGGLAHMQTRARLIAARFDVHSSAEGTQISLRLPLNAVARAS